MGQLDGKIAVITGGGTGIGKAIGEAYAAEGATVILSSRNRERLEEAADGIRAAGGSVSVIPADVTKEDDVVALFKQVKDAHGRLDVLINNAGMTIHVPPDELTLAQWQQVVDVNLTGPFLCAREAFKIMKPQGAGRIINIGSVSAQVSRVHATAYTSTKFGLAGLTRSLALDGREFGIAVCALHPGNVRTPIWEGREEVAEREGTIPLPELAKVAVTIASLPEDVNMLDSIILPVKMPYVGRG